MGSCCTDDRHRVRVFFRVKISEIKGRHIKKKCEYLSYFFSQSYANLRTLPTNVTRIICILHDLVDPLKKMKSNYTRRQNREDNTIIAFVRSTSTQNEMKSFVCCCSSYVTLPSVESRNHCPSPGCKYLRESQVGKYATSPQSLKSWQLALIRLPVENRIKPHHLYISVC